MENELHVARHERLVRHVNNVAIVALSVLCQAVEGEMDKLLAQSTKR